MAISRWKRSAPSRDLGAEHFQRNATAVLEILGEIDGGHAPAPELMLEAVVIGQGVLETLEQVHDLAPSGRNSQSQFLLAGRCFNLGAHAQWRMAMSPSASCSDT